jgi:hypothetical protein
VYPGLMCSCFLCVHICTDVCSCMYIYFHVHVHEHVKTNVHVYVHLYVSYVYVQVCARTRAHTPSPGKTYPHKPHIPVHVMLGIRGQIKVDDMTQILPVNSYVSRMNL